MKYFIANWKSHKTIADGKKWIAEFQKLLKENKNVQEKLSSNSIAIIICPSYHLLYPINEMFASYPNYSLGSQNISPYPEGSYTGEIAAGLLRDLVKFTIVGHSERRKYFHELDGDIDMRIDSALEHNISPILCVRSEHDEIHRSAKIVAYEPVEAIGTGQNALVTDVLEMKKKMEIGEGVSLLYGGSVDENNCLEYVQTDGIDGLLIGTASLEPAHFFSIISKYCQ